MRKFILSAITLLDLLCWALVLLFFCGSAILSNGDILRSTTGALGIILDMFCIAIAIEIIIECLKNTKGIGTLTGFITNGPEAICLLVGLLVGDIIFAASTPLGSNFMNPLLLLVATLVCHQFTATSKTAFRYTFSTICITAALAGSFFIIPPSSYLIWLLVCLPITLILFYYRPTEAVSDTEEYSFHPAIWLLPAVIALTVGGYYLDPVVTYAAHHSHAPKGVIGFFVLATLTSWPEFKSCIVLLKRGKHLAAVMNITVSNITNIWLAIIGVGTYLILG